MSGQARKVTTRLPYVLNGTSGAQAPVNVAYRIAATAQQEPAGLVEFQNIDSVDAIRVYLPQRTDPSIPDVTYRTVFPRGIYIIPADIKTIWVTAAANTPAYEITVYADKFRI